MGVPGTKLGRSLGVRVFSLSRVDRDGWRDAQPCVGSPTPGENTIVDVILVQGSFGQSSGDVKLGTEVLSSFADGFLAEGQGYGQIYQVRHMVYLHMRDNTGSVPGLIC